MHDSPRTTSRPPRLAGIEGMRALAASSIVVHHVWHRPVDWVYVDDMIEAFVRAGLMEAAVGETIELGSGVLTPVREVVESLYHIIGWATAPAFGSIPDRSLEVVRAAATERAASLLGWHATTALEEGLRRTVEWYREHPS